MPRTTGAAGKDDAAHQTGEVLEHETTETTETAEPAPSDRTGKFPEGSYLVDDLVARAHENFEHPAFLVNVALSQDGKPWYTVDEARAVVEKFAATPVEG